MIERLGSASKDVALRASGLTHLFRFAFGSLFCTVILLSPARMCSQMPSVDGPSLHSTPVMVIGFVGGFVHSDDFRHSEVQLIEQLQLAYGNSVHAEIFENRRIDEARSFILDSFGKLSDQEKAQLRIILFGHSWGASAVVYLARDLERDGIPVALTIQVDSVRKHGQNDSIIPSNVKEAINFYQTGAMLHGRSKISASDPSRTAILGNFRFQYAKEPAACRDYPWYNRLLFKGHTSIECDPRVWSQVSTLIRMRLPATAREVAALPQGPHP